MLAEKLCTSLDVEVVSFGIEELVGSASLIDELAT